MIDIKALKELNKLRIYVKLPVTHSDQVQNSSSTDGSANQYLAGWRNSLFAGDYKGFYRAHSFPGDCPDFSSVTADQYVKIFEAFTGLGQSFKVSFSGFSSTPKSLIDFSDGSFGMKALDFLGTMTNFMPTLDMPVMSTYKGVEPISFSVDCSLSLEEWKEMHSNYLAEHYCTPGEIINYCYNYPILRLLSLTLPHRAGKFGTSIDAFNQGYDIGQNASKQSYASGTFDAGTFVSTLSSDSSVKNNTGVKNIQSQMNVSPNDYQSEGDIRLALANPSNYITTSSDADGLPVIDGDSFFQSLGIAFGEMTDTDNGSDNTIVKLFKYLGQGAQWILKEGKSTLDNYIGDIYYLKPPFTFDKLAKTDNRDFVVFLGGKRFDGVFLTGVSLSYPAGFYEGGVPAKIDISLNFNMRRMPTVDTFDNFLYFNDPTIVNGYDNVHYDDIPAAKSKTSLAWDVRDPISQDSNVVSSSTQADSFDDTTSSSVAQAEDVDLPSADDVLDDVGASSVAAGSDSNAQSQLDSLVSLTS